MKPWALALGGSLALHLALVAAVRSEVVAPALAPSVEKRGDGFVSFTAVSLVPKAAQAPSAPAKGAPAPARSAKPVAAAAVKVAPGSGELVAEVAVEGPSETAQSSLEDAAGEAPQPDPLPGAGRGGEPQGNEEQVISLVHARLAAAADRCYPAAARRFQQRGTVQLSFCTDAQGGTANASITHSSGAELLDAAARGCVLESAVPFPREASARCFSVPVRFGLAR